MKDTKYQDADRRLQLAATLFCLANARDAISSVRFESEGRQTAVMRTLETQIYNVNEEIIRLG